MQIPNDLHINSTINTHVSCFMLICVFFVWFIHTSSGILTRFICDHSVRISRKHDNFLTYIHEFYPWPQNVRSCCWTRPSIIFQLHCLSLFPWILESTKITLTQYGCWTDSRPFTKVETDMTDIEVMAA